MRTLALPHQGFAFGSGPLSTMERGVGWTRPGRASWLRAAALLIFGSAIVDSADAQWSKNPMISCVDSTAPFIMVPVGGGVASIDHAFKAHMLESHGVEAGVGTLLSYLFCIQTGGTATLCIGTASGLVGCPLGENRFALAYRVEPESEFGNEIQAAIFDYDPFLKTFSIHAGPVAVGTGTDISITPNLKVDGSTDGVLLAWHDHATITGGGGMSFAVYEIRQQGLRDDGSKIWSGVNAEKGAAVWGTPSNPFDSVYEGPTVVSDGNGLAIVTYPRRNEGTHPDGEPENFRAHYTTKLDASGDVLWTRALLAQHLDSPGDCVATRDGSGGAFYSFANDSFDYYGEPITNLIRARVDGDGNTGGSTFWFESRSPLVRPLAIAPTRYGSAVLAYRDHTGVRSIAFSEDAGLPILWTTFLQGATSANTEEAVSLLGPDYVVFAWTAWNRVVAAGLDEVSGAAVWSAGTEMIVDQFSIDASVAMAPKQPRVVPTWINCGSYPKGFIVGWLDGPVDEAGSYFAERLNDEGFVATGCLGDLIDYGSGTTGGSGFKATLSGSGYPEPGVTVTIRVDHAAPMAPCVLLIGFSPTSLPFKGGTLYVAPPFLTAMFPTNPLGEVMLPLALPNDPGLTGLNVFMQAVILDAQAPTGIALTNGLQITIG